MARATLTEDGVLVAAMSVDFDYGDLHSTSLAAAGAKARIQIGATPTRTEDVEVAGPDGPEEARKITYTFTAKGREGEPPKGTKLEGLMVAGVDGRSRPYLVTVNSQEGTLSDRDVSDIVESIVLKETKKK